jgi:hypothetical protein
MDKYLLLICSSHHQTDVHLIPFYNQKTNYLYFFCSSLVHVSVACDYFLLDESSNSWIKCTIWAYLSAYMRTQICRPSANTSVYANMHFHMGQEYDSSFKLISRLNLYVEVDVLHRCTPAKFDVSITHVRLLFSSTNPEKWKIILCVTTTSWSHVPL